MRISTILVENRHPKTDLKNENKAKYTLFIGCTSGLQIIKVSRQSSTLILL